LPPCACPRRPHCAHSSIPFPFSLSLSLSISNRSFCLRSSILTAFLRAQPLICFFFGLPSLFVDDEWWYQRRRRHYAPGFPQNPAFGPGNTRLRQSRDPRPGAESSRLMHSSAHLGGGGGPVASTPAPDKLMAANPAAVDVSQIGRWGCFCSRFFLEFPPPPPSATRLLPVSHSPTSMCHLTAPV